MITAKQQTKFEALVTELVQNSKLARFQVIANLIAKGITPETV